MISEEDYAAVPALSDRIPCVSPIDPRDTLSGMSDRHLTPPPVPTPETNWSILDSVVRQQVQHAETLQEMREILIELAGRSGKDGAIGALAQDVSDSRTSQGKRIGSLESDVGKLKQTRAQLYVVAAVAMALAGTVINLLWG